MAVNLEIDELLYRLLAQQNLLKIAPILARDSVIRIDHLYYVKDDKLTVSLIFCELLGTVILEPIDRRAPLTTVALKK